MPEATPAAPEAAPATSSSPAPAASSAPASSGGSSAAPAAGNTGVPPVKALGNTTPEAAPQGETAAEKKARLLKLKIDGAEEEIDINSLSDEKLARELQMARAASKRMQEAATVQKQFQDIREFIKRDPFAALSDPAFGLDLDKLMEERFAQRYKEATMPEGEKEKYALQKKLQEYEAREQQRVALEQQQQQQALQQRVEAQYVKDFNEALNQFGLPKTPETMAMIAEVARYNLDNFGIELTPAQMANEVKERLEGINRGVVSSLKGDALLKYLGDEVVKEVIRTSVARVKNPQAPTPAAQSGAQGTKVSFDDEKPARKIQSAAAFRKFIRS